MDLKRQAYTTSRSETAAEPTSTSESSELAGNLRQTLTERPPHTQGPGGRIHERPGGRSLHVVGCSPGLHLQAHTLVGGKHTRVQHWRARVQIIRRHADPFSFNSKRAFAPGRRG